MKRILALLLATTLGGCVSTVQNAPNPTATEQLLVSHSAERAASGLNLHLPEGSKVFLDTTVSMEQAINTTTSSGTIASDRYVVQAVKAHLIGHKLIMVDTKAEADIIVSLRISADSIDDLERVLGVPATTIPATAVAGLSTPISIPELSLFSEHQRSGVVEISALATDAHTGKLLAAQGPIFATAKIVNRHILTGFLFGDELERPGIRAGVVK